MRPFATIALLACLLIATGTTPVAAKTVTIPITWSVSKGNLSIARLRASVGPKVRDYVCTTYRKGQHPGNVLRTGGTVKVVFYGFGRDILTSFTYSKRNCG
jgi:hypothetical protein